jgi:hypothetical protein
LDIQHAFDLVCLRIKGITTILTRSLADQFFDPHPPPARKKKSCCSFLGMVDIPFEKGRGSDQAKTLVRPRLYMTTSSDFRLGAHIFPLSRTMKSTYKGSLVLWLKTDSAYNTSLSINIAQLTLQSFPDLIA